MPPPDRARLVHRDGRPVRPPAWHAVVMVATLVLAFLAVAEVVLWRLAE